MYEADSDPYLDPETEVLKNKLGLRRSEELERAEANVTSAIIASMVDQPVEGNFDLAHLRTIHRRLFGAIYEWAGELRTVELTKDTTRFAAANFLEQTAATLFSKLASEQLLVGLPRKKYIAGLAHYYSELNILHPFREGNGRTQRAFFTLLARRGGYHIAWDRMNVARHLAACIAAYKGDEAPLQELLDELLEAE